MTAARQNQPVLRTRPGQWVRAVATRTQETGVHSALSGQAQPLDTPLRHSLEQRFEADFSHVRVHADGEAARSAYELNANAYSVGQDLVFGAGRYRPGDPAGRRLIAHELAHVAQRGDAPDTVSLGGDLRPSAQGDAWERDADRMAGAALAPGVGSVRPQVSMSGAPVVMRQPVNTTPPEPVRPIPWFIPGTSISVVPVEPANGGESIVIFGYRLPYRVVRLSNELDARPLLPLPEIWREASRTGIDPTTSIFGPGGVAGALGDHRSSPDRLTVGLPRFTITLSTHGGAVYVTDRVPLSLSPDVVPGTPLDGPTDQANVRNHELINPAVSLGKRLYATATLSLRDPYPEHYVSPTQISVTALSKPLAGLEARRHGDSLDYGTVLAVRANALGIGGVKGDLAVFHDLARIKAALAPLGLDGPHTELVIDEIVALIRGEVDRLRTERSLGSLAVDVAALGTNGGLARTLESVVRKHMPSNTPDSRLHAVVDGVVAEVLGPGFSIGGPIFFGVPIGYLYLSADTTRRRSTSFGGSGIGSPFPSSTVAMVGPALIPAGQVSDISVPAVGAMLARDAESFALSATVAAKPVLDPGSVGAVGVAAARLAFRFRGLDIVLNGGWRGQTSFGRKAQGQPSLETGLHDLADERQKAAARFVEESEGSEEGAFAPDRPADVLSDPRPTAEFFGNFSILKRI